MKDFIAIFDSGIGGLTVYSKVKEMLPNENLVYLADTLNCPYGVKSMDEIHHLSMNNIKYLKDLGAKMVIIACNTATSSVVKEIRESHGYLQGVIEPTANLAKRTTKNKKIGLFATNLTVSSKVYEQYLEGITVFSEGCSDFVPVIESGDFNSNNMKLMIVNHLTKINDADTLILGCTHFPYIKDSILQQNPKLLIVESGIATVEEVKKYLINNNLTSNCKIPKYTFLTTSLVDEAKKQLNTLKIVFDEVKHVDIK